jgi:hypothetical protein
MTFGHSIAWGHAVENSSSLLLTKGGRPSHPGDSVVQVTMGGCCGSVNLAGAVALEPRGGRAMKTSIIAGKTAQDVEESFSLFFFLISSG